MKERKLNVYPRFIGGPHNKQKIEPYSPRWNSIEIASLPGIHRYASLYGGDPSEIVHEKFKADVYHKHRIYMGRNRVVDFYAHESLRGEEATDMLFTDMLRRVGAKLAKP